MRNVTRTRGVISASGQVVSCPTENWPTVGVELAGTWVGTLQISDAISGDALAAAQVFNAAGVSISATISANGRYFVAAAGRSAVSITPTAWTSGQVTIVMLPTDGNASAAASGGGGAVTVGDGGDATQGTTTDAAATTDTQNTTIVAFWKRLLSRLTTLLPQVAGRLSVDGSGVMQPVSGTVTANAGTGTLAVSAASLPLPTGAAQDRTTAAAPGAVELSDGGAFYTGAKTGQLPAALVAGRLDVNLGAAAATVSEQGDVAHGTTDSGNPVKQGAVAIAHGANPAPVAAAARTNLYANRAGVPFIIGGHPNPITVRANFTTAQTNTALVAGSAGSKIVVTGFMVTASNANTANVSAVLGLAASVTPTAGQVVGAHPGVAAGSGFGRGAGAGILGVGADADALLLTSSVPTGGSIDVLVQYYTVPS